MSESQALSGKVIAIVGGTGGLGRSAARACVAAGARVVVVGRDADRVEETTDELGDSARGLAGNARDSLTAPRAIELAVGEFERLDGLYHVAGGSGRSFGDGPLHEITDEGWRQTLELNLDALFYSNRAATRYFLENEQPGSILNLGSVLGSHPSPEYFTTHAYAAAKAAIIGLTRTSAAAYAVNGIRFNVVVPALVETPMARRAVENDEIQRFIRDKQPLDGGRVGLPADLDAAVVFFLSDASKFVTAQALHVDGGWSISEGRPRNPESPE